RPGLLLGKERARRAGQWLARRPQHAREDARASGRRPDVRERERERPWLLGLRALWIQLRHDECRRCLLLGKQCEWRAGQWLDTRQRHARRRRRWALLRERERRIGAKLRGDDCRRRLLLGKERVWRAGQRLDDQQQHTRGGARWADAGERER